MSDDSRDNTPNGSASSPHGEPPRYRSGETIAGKYELIRCLGEGGMGSVWVARNLTLDAQVAIKLIKADVRSRLARERLLTEARAAARLKHPAIVRVFDFGSSERDDPFIVMELLAGESLGNLLFRERRLPAIHAVQLVLPILDALHVAHAGGVVHRDLKPDNVFLASYDGRVLPKVVDFGVAKVEQEAELENRRLTESGSVVGSPEYMAPEQAAGEDLIDHRVDIWGACMMLYECITGRTAFRDGNYHALLRKIIENEPRSILEFGAGDAALWQIISRGLEKDPEQRWQSMLHLGRALAEWLVSHGIREDVSGHGLRSAWLNRRPQASEPDGVYVAGLAASAQPSWRPQLDSREEGTVPGGASLFPPPEPEPPSRRQSQTGAALVTRKRARRRPPRSARRYRIGVAVAAAALLLLALVLGLLPETSDSRTSVEVTPAPSPLPVPSLAPVFTEPAPAAAAPLTVLPIQEPAAVSARPTAPPSAKASKPAPARTARRTASPASSKSVAPVEPSAAPKASPPRKVYEDLGF